MCLIRAGQGSKFSKVQIKHKSQPKESEQYVHVGWGYETTCCPSSMLPTAWYYHGTYSFLKLVPSFFYECWWLLWAPRHYGCQNLFGHPGQPQCDRTNDKWATSWRDSACLTQGRLRQYQVSGVLGFSGLGLPVRYIDAHIEFFTLPWSGLRLDAWHGPTLMAHGLMLDAWCCAPLTARLRHP